MLFVFVNAHSADARSELCRLVVDLAKIAYACVGKQDHKDLAQGIAAANYNGQILFFAVKRNGTDIVLKVRAREEVRRLVTRELTVNLNIARLYQRGRHAVT